MYFYICVLSLAVPTDARNLTATPAITYATLTWLPPAQPNGNVFYFYTITVAETGILVTSGVTASRSATITGLDAFTNYTFSVTAATFVGSSNPVTSTFMTLQGSKLIRHYFITMVLSN